MTPGGRSLTTAAKGTLEGFPSPPATGLRRRSRLRPYAIALLMLGAADLAFLNVWAFPRVGLPERVARAMSTPAPAVAVVAVAPAPTIQPLAQPVSVERPGPTERPPAEQPPGPAEAPAPQETAARVEAPAPPETTRGARRVFFAHNQHALTPEAARALAAVVRRRGAAGRILIEGHADRTGVEVYNGWLSEQRAEAVAGALAALGIDRQRMEVRAYGSRRPAVESGEVKAVRRNRRVEISFIGEVTGER